MAPTPANLELQLRNLAGSLSDLVGVMKDNATGGEGSGSLDGRRTIDRTTGGGTGGEKALKAFTDQLVRTSSDYSRQVLANIRTVSDANNHFSMSINERVAIMEDFENQMAAGVSEAEIARQSLEQFGYAVDLRTTSSQSMLREEIANHEALAKAMKRTEMANHLAERGARSFFDTYVKGNKAFVVAAALAKEAYEVSTVALKNGGEITAQAAWQARALGMSHAELIQVTSDYRQNMNAAGMSTNEFNDMMQEGSYEMVKYTGNLKDGAKLAAENMRLYRMVGADAQGGADGFRASMDTSFIALQDMTGATAEEFTKLNSALLSNTDVQANMYKMNKKDRTVYMQEMSMRRNALVQGGLLEEQANAVIEGMEKMGGATAKDRLKDAAKLQATLGAMGMGAQGQEAGDILRKGSRASAGEKARLETIMKEANMVASERGQGSIQSEMVQDYLNAMNPMLGPASPLAVAVTQLANAIDPKKAGKDEPSWMKDFAAMIAKWGDIGKAVVPIISGAIGIGFALVAKSQMAGAAARGAGGAVVAGGKWLLELVSKFKLLIPLIVPLLAPLAGLIIPVVAVTAAFAGAYFATKKLLEIFPGVGEAIGDFIWDSVQWVKEVWPKAKAWVTELPEKFVTGIKELWPAVKNFVMVELPAKIGGAFSGIAEFFSSYFKGFGSLLKAGFVYLKDKALGIFGDNDADEKWEAAKAQFAEGPPKDMWGAATEGVTDIVLPVAQTAAQLEIAAADLAKEVEERKLAAAANDELARETAKAFGDLIALGKAQLKEIMEQRKEEKERRDEEKEEAKVLTNVLGKTAMSAR